MQAKLIIRMYKRTIRIIAANTNLARVSSFARGVFPGSSLAGGAGGIKPEGSGGMPVLWGVLEWVGEGRVVKVLRDWLANEVSNEDCDCFEEMIEAREEPMVAVAVGARTVVTSVTVTKIIEFAIVLR